MENLEKRINKIDSLFDNKTEILLKQKNLLEILNNIEITFLNNKIEKNDDFEQKKNNFLNFFNKWKKEPTLALPIPDKLKLILMTNEIIENLQTDFDDLNLLKRHLEFNPIYENEEKKKNLDLISHQIPISAKQFLNSEQLKDDLLSLNNKIVEDLNKKFLFLDSMLTIREKNNTLNK